MRTKTVVPLTAILIGLLLGLSGLPAAAASAYGAWGVFDIYKGRGGVDNTSKIVITETRTTGGVVPAGWLGAKAQGVNANTGSLCLQSSWYYNGATSSSMTVGLGSAACNGNPVYSWSVSRGWYSALSSYNEYWGAFSPALNF